MARSKIALVLCAALTVSPALAQTVLDASDPVVAQKPKLGRGSDFPEYPGSALRSRRQGEVKLGLCVDSSGRVTSAEVVQSTGHRDLDKSALDWIKNAKFAPALVNGTATAVCNYKLVYEFKLDPTMDYPRYSDLKPEDRPRLIATAPDPAYPEEALKSGAYGKVKVSLCLDPTGKVQTIAMLTPKMHAALLLATGKWAAKSSYSPAMKKGAPVGVCGVDIERDWQLPHLTQ
jgi:TonB family protein